MRQQTLAGPWKCFTSISLALGDWDVLQRHQFESWKSAKELNEAKNSGSEMVSTKTLNKPGGDSGSGSGAVWELPLVLI